MLNILINTTIFIFGLIVGSFLNCLIYRLEVGKSVFKERSFCPHCQHKLAWYDLIPILSFIILGGKCRYCKGKISWQYPLVELFTGIIFLLVFIFQLNLGSVNVFYTSINILYYWIISAFLIVIFVYDLKHYLILDCMIYPAIIISLLFCVFTYFTGELSLLSHFLSAFIPALIFFLIVFISKGVWMGVADIKLAFLIGLILGWPKTLAALAFGFYSGALVGILLMFLKKKELRSEIPFAPFLIAGIYFALFFGSSFLSWYQSFILLK